MLLETVIGKIYKRRDLKMNKKVLIGIIVAILAIIAVVAVVAGVIIISHHNTKIILYQL